ARKSLLLGYYVLVWGAWLLGTAAIFWLARRFPIIPFHWRNALVHVVAANVIAMLHAAYWCWLMLAMRPFDVRTAMDVSVIATFWARAPLEWILYCLVLGASIAFDF